MTESQAMSAISTLRLTLAEIDRLQAIEARVRALAENGDGRCRHCDGLSRADVLDALRTEANVYDNIRELAISAQKEAT